MSSDENLAYFTRVLDLNQSFFGQYESADK